MLNESAQRLESAVDGEEEMREAMKGKSSGEGQALVQREDQLVNTYSSSSLDLFFEQSPIKDKKLLKVHRLSMSSGQCAQTTSVSQLDDCTQLVICSHATPLAAIGSILYWLHQYHYKPISNRTAKNLYK